LLRRPLGSGKGEYRRSGQEKILEWEPLCILGGEKMHLFVDFVMSGEYSPSPSSLYF